MQKHLQIIPRAKAKDLGIMFYFTGKPCIHGHFSERNVKTKICRSCTISHSKSRRDKNPEEVKEHNKKWYANNTELAKARAMKWHYENRDRVLDKQKIWKRDNEDLCRSYGLKRRAKIKQGDSHSKVAEWVSSQKKICEYCGVDCEDRFEVDHIHPISRGGMHIVENLAIACRSCNASKYNKTLEEWRRK